MTEGRNRGAQCGRGEADGAEECWEAGKLGCCKAVKQVKDQSRKLKPDLPRRKTFYYRPSTIYLEP